MSAIKAVLKTEPSAYSFDELERDRVTLWTGIHNYAALRNLEQLKIGDAVAVYHTGSERAAVGIAIVTKAAHRPRGEPNPKFLAIEVRAGRRFAKPVTLESLKEEPLFADSPLVTMGRLSVVPLTPEQSDRMAVLAGRRRETGT
ncbi:MAG TPA: EVE domain-containing protein [Thermoanaerobaculia bacterium]|jgi:predicted RNA-binding protein with PUA-like domain|nr:EVE domain-containing protein [Thermoanaerobaculia bacterium]